MEVDFYSGNRIEGSGPYQPPYYSIGYYQIDDRTTLIAGTEFP